MLFELTIDGLTVDFGGFRAVDNFTTTVEKGELRVILGPNGAGKTTLMDLISGRTKVTSGTVHLFDKNITNLSEHKIARSGVGRKFQIPSVFRELTARENLEVAANEETSIIGSLKFSKTNKELQIIDEVVETCSLEGFLNKPAGELAHGQMQWLELGMLIAQRPRLILLDEPTAGMTRDETYKTAAIIKQLKGKHTLVVVEHDMAFIKEIAEKITVMHLGKLLAHGNISDIENNVAVQEAYLGSGGIH